MKSVCVQRYGGKSIVLLCLSFLLLYSISIYPQNIGLTENKLNTKENFEERRDFSFYEKLLEYDNENKQSTDSNLTLLSTFNMGPCYDAVPSGNYLYAGNGGLFQVLDITNPANPFVIGEIMTSGIIYDIELYGSYVIITAPFTVIDIADPFNPAIVYTDQAYTMYELYIEGHFAFVSGWGTVHIMDIDDPMAPEYLSSVYTYSEFVLAIASKGNYLYTTDGYFTDVFNIEDKNNPFYVRSYNGGWGGLYARDNYLYSAAYGKFKIYDISDPSQLILVNQININGPPCEDLTIQGNLAYMTLGSRDSSGMAILYIGDPLSLPEPLYIDSKNSPLGHFKCEIQNNFAFISTGVGLDIYSIMDPYSPSYLNSYLTAVYKLNLGTVKMKIIGGLLYTLTLGGLKIFDYSDPFQLKKIGEYQQKRIIDDFEISGNYAYLLSENAVEILNIENKDLIYKINELIIPDSLYYYHYASIILKDSTIIASIPRHQVKFINVSNPYNIFITDSLASTQRVYELALKNDYLFSAEGSDGLRVYNIKNIPYIVHFVDSVTRGFIVEDDLLYVSYLKTLSIYNIADPESLIFLGSTLKLGTSSEIDKSGQYVVLPSNSGIEVIDVSDPYNPFIAAFSRSIIYSGGIASFNNLIFTTYEEKGIMVFKNDLITGVNETTDDMEQAVVFQSYPNPFNIRTIIKYKIKHYEFIKITIYDLLGRKIETLENNWKEGGEYSVEFSGSNLSSGVYFCCLQIDDEVISTIKLQLIK